MEMENNNLQDIKAELQSLVDITRAKIELEKGIGMDVMAISRTQGPTPTIPTSPKGSGKGEGDEKHAPTSRRNQTEEISTASLKEAGQSKDQRLLSLKKTVLECKKCGLCKSRNNVVFGSGNPEADLMFVGEAPGHEEDVQGEPFVGRAGQLLTKIIEAIGLKREDVYIANVLKCRPPGNRSPRGDEIVLCFPHLAKQIEIIRPRILCALGAFAAQTLLDTKESIGALRGKFYDYKGIKFLATYHPAYLLRNPNDKGKTWDDMKKIRDMLLKIKEGTPE